MFSLVKHITYQQKKLKSTSQSPILRSFSNLPCSILQLPSRPSSSQGFVPRRAHHGWTYRPIFKHHQVILWMVAKSCTQRMVENPIVGLYVFFSCFYHLSTGAGWTATIHDISSLLMSLAWFEGASPSRPTTFGWTHEPTPRHIHPGGGSCASPSMIDISDIYESIWINDMWQYQWGMSQNCWIHTQNGSIHGNSHTSGTWVFKDSLTTWPGGFSAKLKKPIPKPPSSSVGR